MEEHKQHKYYHKQQQERIRDSKGYRLRVDCVCYKDAAKKEVSEASMEALHTSLYIHAGSSCVQP